jgi:protein kinase-like protein/cyclic nucleotide-binding protein
VAGPAGGAEQRNAAEGAAPREAEERAAAGFGTELSGKHRFRLMKQLGRGRFGSVFLARCVDPDLALGGPPERVAVKVFPCGRREVRALRRELAALLAIRHPRVPRVHDWSTEGRHAFVAMDHFERGSLAARIAPETRPDEDEVWRLLENLLEALAIAHQASILHLDVKPSNVLMGDDGFALSDFGISEASRAGGIAPRAKGTPGYRAPEQRDERYAALDGRTDLYGAGATAWAFATGLDLARHLRLGKPGAAAPGAGLPYLDELRGDLSPSLRWLVAELLRSDPEERPGSACEALARLRAISGRAEPPHADIGSAGERLAPAEAQELIEGLVDPVTVQACRDAALHGRIVRLAPGELLCIQGEPSDSAFLLLRGVILVERAGHPPLRVTREGELMGEVAALSGRPRNATISAAGPAWVCVLNAAQFERLVAAHPALGVRLLRAMAERYA